MSKKRTTDDTYDISYISEGNPTATCSDSDQNITAYYSKHEKDGPVLQYNLQTTLACDLIGQDRGTPIENSALLRSLLNDSDVIINPVHDVTVSEKDRNGKGQFDSCTSFQGISHVVSGFQQPYPDLDLTPTINAFPRKRKRVGNGVISVRELGTGEELRERSDDDDIDDDDDAACTGDVTRSQSLKWKSSMLLRMRKETTSDRKENNETCS